MHAIEMIFKDGFSIWHFQDLEGNAILRSVSDEQISLHPRRISRMINKEMVKVWVCSNTVLNQTPIPKLNRNISTVILIRIVVFC
jgi:hypothetical protein